MAKKPAALKAVPNKPTPKKEEATGKTERFIRIVSLGRGEGHYEAFQPELIEVSGDRVISRKMLSKPNVYEHAFAHGADLLDPRNEVKYERAPV